MRQHVTNPTDCIQCSACEMACPRHAIENIAGRFCIDAAVCENCGACIKECPTGAADCYLDVEAPYSVQEQSEWIDSLPRKTTPST